MADRDSLTDIIGFPSRRQGRALVLPDRKWWPLNFAAGAILLVPGFFLAPMALLAHAIFHDLKTALNVGFVLGEIGKVVPAYLGCVIRIAIVTISQGLATVLLVHVLDPLPLLGDILLFIGLAFVVLYGGMVSCYLLGRLYFRFADTFEWLEPDDE